MDDKNIYLEVVGLIATNFKLEEKKICSHSHFKNDLGLDSVDIMDSICLIEERFKVKILLPDTQRQEIPETVEGLVLLIKKKLDIKK